MSYKTMFKITNIKMYVIYTSITFTTIIFSVVIIS